jgi:hypothetical protein
VVVEKWIYLEEGRIHDEAEKKVSGDTLGNISSTGQVNFQDAASQTNIRDSREVYGNREFEFK